jgi:hypothetical protein
MFVLVARLFKVVTHKSSLNMHGMALGLALPLHQLLEVQPAAEGTNTAWSVESEQISMLR